MLEKQLTKFLLLPKLKLLKIEHMTHKKVLIFHCESNSKTGFCPHCGLESKRVHDYRIVRVLDSPHETRRRVLKIKKKRFRCMGIGCKKVFTEQLDGISKHAKLTERMQRHILYKASNFANLKDVQKTLSIGTKTIYQKHYKQLELEWRKRKNDPWPKTVGIDEHSFIRNKQYGHKEFATVIVDYNNKRIKELVPGRTVATLQHSLRYIKGRENVKNVAIDLSPTYRSFAQNYFPNAKIIADKFHVVRLLNNTLNVYRKKIFGDKRKLRVRKLLLMNAKNIDYFTRFEFHKELKKYPELWEIYMAKESLHKLYRCKGEKWARRVFRKLTDALALTKIKELQTFRRTLLKWQSEILNYFENRITNAQTEGFNTVCKQLQKRAYGYKNFYNYRLKVLYACQ